MKFLSFSPAWNLKNIFSRSLVPESFLTLDRKNPHYSNDNTEDRKYLIAISWYLEQSHLQQWRIIFHQRGNAEESTWQNLGREWQLNMSPQVTCWTVQSCLKCQVGNFGWKVSIFKVNIDKEMEDVCDRPFENGKI